MANRISIQAQHASRLQRAALRAPILKPIPMLLAAMLFGCASSGHHTTGALTQQPAKPVPVASSATPDEEMPPTVFKDEGGEPSNESPARPERFEDDAAAQDDGGNPGPDRFADETGNVTPEENFAQRPFVADEAPPADDAVVAQQFTDDSGTPKDEAIVAPERFTDDTPAVKDESVGHDRFTDDAAPAKDDDFAAHQQFTDDTPAVKDETVVTEEYTDDATPATPEQFVRTPEPVARNVAEAHESEARPATMLPMTVTVEADPLFEFDRASIGAEARKKLDELIQQLKGIPYGEVITLGYTDPIGTESYNRKLSERRAESVSRYLVNNGIPADKIKVEARGETEEFASYRACKAQGKQHLIDCLHPDRRVEVTVTTPKEQ